jgi:hypothetical protein
MRKLAILGLLTAVSFGSPILQSEAAPVSQAAAEKTWMLLK